MTWLWWLSILLVVVIASLLFAPQGSMLQLWRKFREWIAVSMRRLRRAGNDGKPTESSIDATAADKPKDANWPSRKNVLIMLAIIAGIVIFVSLALWGYQFPHTGFGQFSYDIEPNKVTIPAKNLWDWLDLLIVPAAIAISASLYSWMDRRNERNLNQKRIEEDREIAAKRLEEERSIAEARTQETALETYLQQMSTLLIDKNLRNSEVDAEERNLARTWTLTILRRLSSEKKSLVIQFLIEAGLVSNDPPIVSLLNVDLEEANLEETNLEEANLERANLLGVNLQRANLLGANLQWANLLRANLLGAGLQGADLLGADLQGANLLGARLQRASLLGANLLGARLQRANLQGANLRGANLLGARLQRANLQGANLRGANLREATYSRSTIWPDGFDVASSGAVLVEDDDLA